MDVYFDGELSVVQPDILVVLKEHLHRIKDGRVFGAPNLIIEILSPGNRPHDIQTKKSLYEKAGVKEYFIVDPSNKEVILFAIGGNGRYKESYRQLGILKSAILDNEFSF